MPQCGSLSGVYGSDISDAQPSFPAAWYQQWGFVIVKATEGQDFTAHTFDQKFAAALSTAHRGAYHYARPGHSSGTDQANFFADTVLAHGFRPGVDIWSLDAETGQKGQPGDNTGVSPGQWRQFIVDFMSTATKRLGHLGLLYAGYYFWLKQLSGDHSVLAPYQWWLPWYGSNDGQVHVPDVQLPQPEFIQQFSSAGGLDRNVVDDAAWSSWLQPQTPPPPVVQPPVTIPVEDNVNQTDLSMTLDHQGNGHVPVAGVKAKDVRAVTPIAVPDPAQVGKYLPIPAVSLTIGADGDAEIVVERGAGNGPASVRVLHA